MPVTFHDIKRMFDIASMDKSKPRKKRGLIVSAIELIVTVELVVGDPFPTTDTFRPKAVNFDFGYVGRNHIYPCRHAELPLAPKEANKGNTDPAILKVRSNIIRRAGFGRHTTEKKASGLMPGNSNEATRSTRTSL